MDNVQEVMLIKLQEDVDKYNACLYELIKTCTMLGADTAIDKFLLSPEFEEEACIYCEDMGWKEPA